MYKSNLLTKGLFATVVAGALILAGCAKEDRETSFIGSNSNHSLTTEEVTVNHFKVNLITSGEQDADGNYVWVWKVDQFLFNGNQTPGISHLNLLNFDCLTIDDVVNSAWSTDGSSWTIYSSTSFATDNSTRDCGGDVNESIKFDNGSGSVNYYRLIVNKNFMVAESDMVIKAGSNCYTAQVPSIGCLDDDEEICYAWSDETAWSAGSRYTNRGNWATFTSYDGSAKTVNLFAGQTNLIGTVSFSAVNNGKVNITINFNELGKFQDVESNLKIQGYDKAPSGNPSPGQFANKYTNEVSVTVDEAKFYGIHVDALLRGDIIPCPEI